MREQQERLLDILEAIDRIERYAVKGQAAFKNDELIQTWIIHHLEIISEAASKLGRDFHEQHPQIPWPQLIAMRNLLVHEYFGIDLEEVWEVIEHDLPVLKRLIKEMEQAVNRD